MYKIIVAFFYNYERGIRASHSSFDFTVNRVYASNIRAATFIDDNYNGDIVVLYPHA